MALGVPQRQVKNKKTCLKTESEHVQVQFVVSSSVPEKCSATGVGHCQQRQGRTALLLTAWRVVRNFVRDTLSLLQ